MTDASQHRLYKAPDISCEHCRRAIEAEVGSLGGVTHVHVDVSEKTVEVVFAADLPAAKVRDAIEAAGYRVVEERELE